MAPSSSFFFFFFFFVTLHRLPVIREDDFGTEMFFVVSGSCQCLVKRKVVRIFRENEMFGEIALLKTEPVRRTATIKSELYSELVVLNKTDFLDCLAIHPSAWSILIVKQTSFCAGGIRCSGWGGVVWWLVVL